MAEIIRSGYGSEHQRGDRFIDQFDVLLLDMRNTFMFDVDRFSAVDGLYETYLQFGGNNLGVREVHKILKNVFQSLITDLRDVLNYASAFPAACGGVSEHIKNKQLIDDSSRLAARRVNSLKTSMLNSII